MVRVVWSDSLFKVIVGFFCCFFVFCVCFFFFFFKQKTAYEIYQCDWSSDVCSSDLVKKTIFLNESDGSLEFNIKSKQKIVSIIRKEKPGLIFSPYENDKHHDHQIGRASCRERV